MQCDKGSSPSYRVPCSHVREQSVKSSHSVQYCHNSSVVDYKRALSESGQDGLIMDMKEPVIRSLSWNGVSDSCHGNDSEPWSTEKMNYPVQCCHKSSSRLNENEENG